MTSKDIKVIVTGIGAPGAYGTVFALRKGAQTAGINLQIVGTDTSNNFPLSSYYDHFHHVPLPSDEAYGTALNSIIEKYCIDLVIPQTTAETDWLSTNAESIRTEVLVPDGEAISVANNKYKTAQLYKSLGYSVPDFCLVSSISDLEAAAIRLGYPDKPVVLKPPISNGMRGLRVLDSEALSFESFLSSKPDSARCTLQSILHTLSSINEMPSLMVSEFISGIEYSVDCLITKSSRIAIPRRRDQIRSGISYVSTLVNNESLKQPSLDFANACGLTGVFGMQYIVRDNIPFILECNPRIQGTMIATLASGNNIIWNSVCNHLNLEDHCYSTTNQNWSEITIRRYWGALAFNDDINELY